MIPIDRQPPRDPVECLLPAVEETLAALQLGERDGAGELERDSAAAAALAVIDAPGPALRRWAEPGA